jgi:phage baseplate assembly protein W
MASIGVSLPLTKNSADGFTMLKTLATTVKQNFKMLILTDPGERVMAPNYGVGLKTYLFLNYSEDVHEKIRNKVIEQTSLYMPAISIQAIDFGMDPDLNKLSIQIQYAIPNIGLQDLLEFTI